MNSNPVAKNTAIYRTRDLFRAFQFTQEMAEAYLFDKVPLPSPLYCLRSNTLPPERRIYSAEFRAASAGEYDAPVKVGDWVVTPLDDLEYGDPLVYDGEDFDLSFEVAK